MSAVFNGALIGITCFDCGHNHGVGGLLNTCGRCGMPLRVDLALDGLAPADVIDYSVHSMWRYQGVLPFAREKAVTLTEGWTPLVEAGPLTWVKDEARNPTGSFKARGMTMAVTAAAALGVERLVAPSAGNAAGALAAYGAVAGIPVLVVMPKDTPQGFIEECLVYGAEVELVDGTISEAADWLALHRATGDFDVSTLKEPYRVEGKKTMGYELWEQFEGDLPDVILYPTGGGTGLVGMWKAFDEMETMGWIGPGRPRMVSVQAAGCAPVVEAFERGELRTSPWPDPFTAAYGLRVPSPIAGFISLRAIRETSGTAISVPEPDIGEATAELTARIGVDVCPETGAAWAALALLRERRWLADSDRILLFNTASGAKYRCI